MSTAGTAPPGRSSLLQAPQDHHRSCASAARTSLRASLSQGSRWRPTRYHADLYPGGDRLVPEERSSQLSGRSEGSVPRPTDLTPPEHADRVHEGDLEALVSQTAGPSRL